MISCRISFWRTSGGLYLRHKEDRDQPKNSNKASLAITLQPCSWKCIWRIDQRDSTLLRSDRHASNNDSKGLLDQLRDIQMRNTKHMPLTTRTSSEKGLEINFMPDLMSPKCLSALLSDIINIHGLISHGLQIAISKQTKLYQAKQSRQCFSDKLRLSAICHIRVSHCLVRRSAWEKTHHSCMYVLIELPHCSHSIRIYMPSFKCVFFPDGCLPGCREAIYFQLCGKAVKMCVGR